MENDEIVLKNVCIHNLKGVNLKLKKNHLITITGVSGSGKSSLAFDTLFVEGQRRFVQSLSPSAKRFFPGLNESSLAGVEGITPTIALDQKTRTLSARSTVATLTHVYDFLRILFSSVATAYCPISHAPVAPQSHSSMLRQIFALDEPSSLIFLAPLTLSEAEKKDFAANLIKMGFIRIAINYKIVRLDEPFLLPKDPNTTVDLVCDKTELSTRNKHRILESLVQTLSMGHGVAKLVHEKTSKVLFFSETAFCKESGTSYPPLKPVDFSFNQPTGGMCKTCEGMGWIHDFDMDGLIDSKLSIKNECCALAPKYSSIKWCNIYDNLAELYNFSLDDPWQDLSNEAKQVFLYGTTNQWTKMRFHNHERGISWTEYVEWKGILFEAKKRYSLAKSDVYKNNMHKYMTRQVCSSCKGSRLKSYPSHAQLFGKTIAEVTAMNIGQCLTFFENVTLTGNEKILAGPPIVEIIKRLKFLSSLGLNYLTLDRVAPSLSGGESQRVRLAFQVGSGLTQSTYILDEPSIGLHPRDQVKLLTSLQMLRDRGNTVICVEHDEATMLASDWLVDMGPGAGSEGGQVIFNGPLSKLSSCKNSLTADYITRKKRIPIPKRRKKSPLKPIVLKGACLNNLKNITLEIPLQCFVAIAGVSGSGKSSLITSTLYPALMQSLDRREVTYSSPFYKHLSFDPSLEKILLIDQNPIGRTPRSNPSTYIKLFDDIRDLFARLPQAKVKGFDKGRFSFNVSEGNCPVCSGMGSIKIESESSQSGAWIECAQCRGKRFDSATLGIEYKGKNIADILAMTIREALAFFQEIPPISRKLDLLNAMGLGYLQVGQPSTTLSGGEAQRIKLTKELLRPPKKHTLYILDEPTTGLHFHDIAKLVTILQNMVDLGHSVIIIEHHTDLLKVADHVIELGPDGGEKGGFIVAQGSPEFIAKQKTETAPYIKTALSEKKPILPASKLFKTGKNSQIVTRGACQNTLKDINVAIDHNKITVCTGPSGSGKSSFAIDTLYSEGLRRFTDSLSPYQRQFVKLPEPARVESVTGLCPAISIEQKKHAGSPRSTVGTLTEVYDHIREIFAYLGTATCPDTGEELGQITVDFLTEKLVNDYPDQPLYVLAPFRKIKGESFEACKERIASLGFTRLRLNKQYYHIDDSIPEQEYDLNALFLVVDRLFAKDSMKKRLAEAVETTQTLERSAFVIQIGETDHTINLDFASLKTGKSYPKPHPKLFSFNRDEGRCPECLGLGFQMGALLQEDLKIQAMSVYDLLDFLWQDHFSKSVEKVLLPFLDRLDIDPDDLVSDLTKKQLLWLFSGNTNLTIESGKLPLQWIGLNRAVEKSLQSNNVALKAFFEPFTDKRECTLCKGGRLSAYARSVFLNGISIDQVSKMNLIELSSWINSLTLKKEIKPLLEKPLNLVKEKLKLMQTMGLEYLSLNRGADTLSSGEAQRIYITRQMGSLLTGVLYVLEEPSRGLHPHNHENLISILKSLVKIGNTLIVIDQSRAFIRAADKVLEFGPSGGPAGGQILFDGTVKELMKKSSSLTAQFLSKKSKAIEKAPGRKEATDFIEIKNISIHNLNNLSINLPKGVLCAISGVSGAGKSTLIREGVFKAAEKSIRQRGQKAIIEHLGGSFKGLNDFRQVVSIDQTPLTTSTRGDVSSFLDIKTTFRQFYSSLKESKIRGLLPGHFSKNTRAGMCKSCFGMGYKKTHFQFMAEQKVPCENCDGYGLKPLALKVDYKGKHLGKLVEMTLAETANFLPPMPKIIHTAEILKTLKLDYLRLNQDLSTLSLGEVSRLRLAKEMVKKRRSNTLFLIDEPSAGLHISDLKQLLPALKTLTDKNHSVIIIDHHPDLLSYMDYLIDMGPGAGPKGGKIVAHGPPETIASTPKSLTGRYL
ncbi:excinuclease ABC subunit A [Candidatus Aerophobetes bacterium]|uniref:UvrABC system protein A n=1 Tax=Aerophobetes bacterium TaxID=2030807 RepID=A0A2A4X8A0_UNCAE|nr:MAG: excinuclease ABC subunit A [Candidatus Aerophobetes bacterium]